MKFLKKYHKWLGIVLTLFIILFSLSGIVLNHRQLFSGINVSRNFLPADYRYTNWNNAAVKGSLKLSEDSVLIYGNVGIWLTDTTFSNYTDFNSGFPNGIDNRKIYKLHKTRYNNLLAATLFGLYIYNYQNQEWVKSAFSNTLIMDIAEKQDTVILLTRSHLYKTVDFKSFSCHVIPKPVGYNNKVSLFKTLWIIHSGEIYGHYGKLFTDFIGLVFIFLSISGLIYWIAPKAIRKRKRKQKQVKAIVKVNRFSLKWHNKLGWTFLFFLVLTTATGMFLRPPLLIAIISGEVKKIPFSELDTDNAWYDKLRRIIYDETNDRYVLATIDGVFITNTELTAPPLKPHVHIPISVMGVNVFEQINKHQFLVGSFEGLFVWDELSGRIFDYVERREYVPVVRRGAPIGKHMIAGFSRDFFEGQIIFDYNVGAQNLFLNKRFMVMPNEIKLQPMSLWNLALEFHTMRIWSALIGSFYILLIPLSGLSILFILISGFIVWLRFHRKTKRK